MGQGPWAQGPAPGPTWAPFQGNPQENRHPEKMTLWGRAPGQGNLGLRFQGNPQENRHPEKNTL